MQPKKRFLLVMEGQVTEPQYMRGLARSLRNARIELVVDPTTGVPLTLVDKARARKKEAEQDAKRSGDDYLRFDEVWCVFDTDQHPGLNEARQKANADCIFLAISNPCFELWLLLHFCESAGGKTASELLKDLKKHVPKYGLDPIRWNVC